MNSKTKGHKAKLAAVDSLTSAGNTNAKLVEDLVNEELADVLYERKLKKIKIRGAIFSHLENGLVISGPVSLPDDLTRSDLNKKPQPVGFLVNTLRLVDPVSRRALRPGVSLVELRPLRGGEFAFDYIGGDGKVKMATDTHRSHHVGDRSRLRDPGGTQPEFDIEVNHVIVYPSINELIPWPYICTSFHDGREKCYYLIEEKENPEFTVLD